MNQIVENLKKNPSILFGIVALVIILTVGFLRFNQLTELSVLESELNLQLDRINANIKHSENIEQDTQKLKALVETIDERLFIAEERSTNIDFFYSFEDKLDILISEVDQLERKNIRFSKGGPDSLKLYSVINYEITVEGSFHEILRFLYEIYQTDNIMRISDFQINTTTDRAEASSILSAEVRVAVLAAK